MKLLLIWFEVPEHVKMYVFDTEAGYSVEELRRMGRCHNTFINSSSQTEDTLWLYNFRERLPSIPFKEGEPYTTKGKKALDMIVLSGCYV